MSGRTCSRGHHELPVDGVCGTCRRIAAEEAFPPEAVRPEAVRHEAPPAVEATGDYFPSGEWE